MIAAEELLKPISEQNPCGDDLSYDPSFQELEALMRGKPETQFSPAEDPDWGKLHKRCLELLERSKDLRVATALCLSATKTEGLPSLREAFAFLKGLLEGYWEPVYPRLDPEDNNDPLQRMNILAALSTPRGTYGDPMRFLDRLREVPLASSMQLGRFSLMDIERGQAGQPTAEGQAAVSTAQIEAAFRDTSPETLQGYYQAISDCVRMVGEVDAFITDKVGASKAPDLDQLQAGLKEIQKTLIPYVTGGSPAAHEATAAGDARGVAPAAGQAISGEIQSRQDVVRMLDKICEYYTRAEPASPVPNLLRRAQRLAEMNFMEIINELCPDATGAVRNITGDKSEG
jgi:type VI secretion system protein ImpA